MIPTLAFVPLSDVKNYFMILSEMICEREIEIIPLIDYFELNYIGTDYRRPRFDISIWNQY